MNSATNAVARTLIHGPWVGQLLDAALVHDRNAVRHGQRLLLVVGDVEEGGPGLLVYAPQLGLHLLAQLEVEGSEWLVEQQRARTIHQRAGQRDALSLAARKLSGSPIRQSLEPHGSEHLRHSLGGFVACRVA